jgi:hypothetical protein
MKKLFVLFCVITLINACNTAQIPSNEQGTLDTQSVFDRDSSWTLDSKFAEVSRQVPDFGGAFYDEEGAMNIYMVDASPNGEAIFKEEAISSLTAVFDEEIFMEIRADNEFEISFLEREIKILQGNYSFETLIGWRKELDDIMVEYHSVIFTDIDETTNKILIGITDERSAKEIQDHASKLGIPPEAIDFELGQIETTSLTLTDRVRPLVGGLEITFSRGGRCTLGVNAYHPSLVTYGFVSNSHCSGTEFGLDGLSVFQGGQRLGREVLDPAPFTGGACPSGRQCRYSDTNFIEYEPGISHSPFYAYTKPRAGVPGSTLEIERFESINGGLLSPPSSSNSAWAGVTLHKVGAVTGDTEGTVSNTCANFYNVVGTTTTLLCQTRVRARIKDGDSGSPVLREFALNNDVFYGIAWGEYVRFALPQIIRRYFIFSSYDGIVRDLGFIDLTY